MKLKPFLRPIIFLMAIATILLLSDLHNRQSAKESKEVVRVAVFRFISNAVLDLTEVEIINELEATDLYKNKQLEITRYSPEGDMATANMIAMTVVNEGYDMVVTICTPVLQAMANANKDGKVTHVFCAVTDPFTAGVGISGEGLDEHPPYLVGIGSFEPVENTFRIAKKMNPKLKKVGVVWNVAEACSQSCLKKARAICKELDIELIEAGIENATQVLEAATSITQKGVDALWTGGDNVLESAIDMYLEAGHRANIPVFTNNPEHAGKKAFFCLGTDYGEIGTLGGKMAVEILEGKSPKEFGVSDYAPEELYIDETMIKTFKDKWMIPDDVRELAVNVIK